MTLNPERRHVVSQIFIRLIYSRVMSLSSFTLHDSYIKNTEKLEHGIHTVYGWGLHQNKGSNTYTI